MASKIPTIERDDCYIYDLAENVAKSLVLMYFDSSTVEVQPQPQPQTSSSSGQLKPSTASSNCSTCKLTTEPLPEARKEHYKTDLHRLNLKRAVGGLPPLNEEEFEELLEKQSIESLSGSEDESEGEEEVLDTIFEKLSTKDSVEEEQTVSHLNTKSPLILYKSSLISEDKALGVYKSVFTHEQLLQDPTTTLKSFSQPPTKDKFLALLMIGGGHFAGAIISHKRKNIRGNVNMKENRYEEQVEVIDSKTFHRYTTRRKQGGSQSASDNARGKANSAGSSIRRYNEQALIKEVRELLDSWKHYLNSCESIFIRANGATNRKILVGYEGSVLQNNDSRIKSFPFTTKRATKSELRKAWVELSYLKVVDVPKVNDKLNKRLQLEREARINSQTQVKKTVEEDPPEVKLTIELVSLLKKSKAPMVINFFKKNKLLTNFALQPTKQYIHHPFPLHYASSQGLNHMVHILLVNLKADPTLTNEFGKTAAELSANNSTRKAFQTSRYSLGETYCDWSVAKVGKAKSKEEFAEEEAAEKKKEEAEKKKLIEEELARKTEMELKTPTFSSSGVLSSGGNPLLSQLLDTSGFSEQQKMRLMREQRARAAEARFKKMQGN